jgi:WD40 repeat protein
VAVSSDGRTVASGSTDKTARLWDMTTGKERRALDHSSAVPCLTFSTDGKQLATGTANLVFVWDVETGKKLATLKAAAPVARVAFAADGKSLGASGAGWKTVWDVDTGKEKAKVKGEFAWFALAPDGQTLAISQADGSVQLWDVTKDKARGTLKGHEGVVSALTFSPDSKTLATGAFAGGPKGGGRDKSIKLWDVATSKEKATLVGHLKGIYSLTFAPDGKALLASDYNGSMKLWDPDEARVKSTLEKIKDGDKPRGTPVGFWAISPDLRTWAVGDGQTVSWLDISDFTAAKK